LQPNFWKDPTTAIKNAYRSTDNFILENAMQLGPGGSTAVTAIFIDGKDLWIANVGDSRAVVCEGGCANQLTVDHEPHTERKKIEKKGGFVTALPGNISPFFITFKTLFFFWWNILPTVFATIVHIINWAVISVV
jgi:protein phosphatase 1L